MAKVQSITEPELTPTELRLRAITDKLLNPPTPQSLVLKLIEQAKALVPQPGCEAQMLELLARWEAFIDDQQLNIARQEQLVRNSGEYLREAMGLARSIPAQLPVEQIRKIFPTLQEKYNWSSQLIGFLEYEVAQGERITGCDADSVTTDRRKILRTDMIVKYRPRSMSPDKYEQWERQMTRPEALRPATRPGPGD